MHYVDIGGGEMCFLNFLAHLDREQFEPVVVCPRTGELVGRLQQQEVQVRILPVDLALPVRGTLKIISPQVLIRLVKLIWKENIALLHPYTLYPRNYANAAALITGIPLIYTCHAWQWGEQLRDLQMKLLNTLPKGIIAVSKMIADSLVRRRIIAPEKIQVIHPGVDLNRFKVDGDPSTRTEFGIFADTPLVGIIARFNDVKDFVGFLRAAALVLRERPSVRFLIVGDEVLPVDNHKDTVKKTIRELGLSRSVILAGYRQDIPQVLASLDVLVSSSLRESFGLTLVEAMAAGKPVVATRCGGPEEIVVHGETGFLVPPQDPEALANAILLLVNNKPLAETMGHAGRRRAESHFDLKVHTRKVEALYHSIKVSTHYHARAASEVF
jgi:glycosyltransferase involved in cell wall biosynthesis